MRASDRTTLAVVFSLFLAGFTLAPLTSDRSYLGASWGFLVVLGVTTVLLRRARVGNGLVLLAQLGVAGVLSVGLSLTMAGLGLPWYQHYVGLWEGGVLHMQEQASPMDPHDGVTLIFATIMAGLLILTDLLAAGLSRPAWALAPTATLFLVPALGLGADTGLLSFLLVALGYLGILVADGLNGSARWTRGLSRDSAESVGATPVVWRAATLIGVPALIGTLLLGALLPTLSLPSIGFGGGSGGNGPLQLTDPSLDLRRNLNQPQDKEVIDYQTTAPGGQYLRLASLPQFNAQGWSNVQIRLNTGDQMPAVPGLSGSPDREFRTQISVLDFRSQYLPMPYAPRSFDAEGDWRYDANSLTVVNGENRAESLANLSYSVQSVDVAPEPDALDGAVAGAPVDAGVTRTVPEDLPEDLVRLSLEVTDKAKTAAGKAAAIQAYLRSSRFRYSTQPLPGSGYRALENFLLRDRSGYCEQFATAMAMMARVAGIPSRVSVGFLPGTKDGDTWRVSIRDMHAWPELYFSGYGWVRFEPTPAIQTGSAPPWTLAPSNNPTTSPSDDPSAGPSESAAAPSTGAAGRPRRADDHHRRDRQLPLGGDAAGHRHRPGGARGARGPRGDPGAAAQRPADGPRAGRRAGGGGVGGDPRHRPRLRRLVAQRVAARHRDRDRAPARPGRVGRHGAGRDVGRAGPLRAQRRGRRGDGQAAAADHRDPPRAGRSADPAPAAGRAGAAPLAVPAAPPTLTGPGQGASSRSSATTQASQAGDPTVMGAKWSPSTDRSSLSSPAARAAATKVSDWANGTLASAGPCTHTDGTPRGTRATGEAQA